LDLSLGGNRQQHGTKSSRQQNIPARNFLFHVGLNFIDLMAVTQDICPPFATRQCRRVRLRSSQNSKWEQLHRKIMRPQ
jgi:hypothetical protein